MHSSDIIKAKNEIKYCEILKEHIQKKIEEIKSYFIKNNLIVSDDNEDQMDNVNEKKNLLNLKQIDSLTEDSIYNEIIEEYANYIGNFDSRDFLYSIISQGISNPNEDKMSKQEILEQINNTYPNVDKTSTSSQKVTKKRGRRKKNTDVPQTMNNEHIQEYKELKQTNAFSGINEEQYSKGKNKLEYLGENNEDTQNISSEDAPRGNITNTTYNIKNKFTEFHLSSSEDTPNDDSSYNANDYKSLKNLTDTNDDCSSYSSFKSNDTTAITFKRLNKLKRTSYSEVVSKP